MLKKTQRKTHDLRRKVSRMAKETDDPEIHRDMLYQVMVSAIKEAIRDFLERFRKGEVSGSVLTVDIQMATVDVDAESEFLTTKNTK